MKSTNNRNNNNATTKDLRAVVRNIHSLGRVAQTRSRLCLVPAFAGPAADTS